VGPPVILGSVDVSEYTDRVGVAQSSTTDSLVVRLCWSTLLSRVSRSCRPPPSHGRPVSADELI
jgi:hypothetical protein